MTKEQFIALVRKNPHIRDNFTHNAVAKGITSFYDSAVIAYHMKGGDIASLAKAFEVPVQKNKKLNFYYSDLPVQVIALNGTSKGVRQIEDYVTDGVNPTLKIKYVPVNFEAMSFHEEMGTLGIANVIPYAVIGNQVRYYRMEPGMENVSMYLIPSFDELEDTDELPVFMDMDKILMQVLQYYGVQPPDDDKQLNTKQ